jgi:hypothetical protein
MIAIRRTAATLIAAVTVASSAWAAGKDYRFELAGSPPPTGKAGPVKVRLVHLPDGKPVRDAVVFESRFDMGPDGMPTMTAPAKPLKGAGEGGVYEVRVEPSMAGNWALALAAKVQGEPETVRGTVTLVVPK